MANRGTRIDGRERGQLTERMRNGESSTLSVTDVISEGPIYGLVDNEASVFLDNDRIATVEAAGSRQINSQVTLTFTSGSKNATLNTASQTVITALANGQPIGVSQFVLAKNVYTSTVTKNTVGSGNILNRTYESRLEADNFFTTDTVTGPGARSGNFLSVLNAGTASDETKYRPIRLKEISGTSPSLLGNGLVEGFITDRPAASTGFSRVLDTAGPNDYGTFVLNTGEYYASERAVPDGDYRLEMDSAVGIANVSGTSVTLKDNWPHPSGTHKIENLGLFAAKDLNHKNQSVGSKIPSTQVQFLTGHLTQPPLSGSGGHGSSAVTVNIGQQFEQSSGYGDGTQAPKTLQGGGNLGLSSSQLMEVDTLIFRINYGSGFYARNGDGDDKTTYIRYKIAAQVKENGVWSALFGHKTVVHKGMYKNARVFEHEIDLDKLRPFEDFKIVVSRMDSDDDDGYSAEGKRSEDWTNVTAAQIATVTLVTKDILNYPLTAMGKVSFNTKRHQKMPKRSYHAKGLLISVPSNYVTRDEASDGVASYNRDPDTELITSTYQDWDGSFRSEKVYTNNPAWIFYDILTNNRYGLGDFINSLDVDKYALYRLGRYCDELVSDGKGGLEPRYTLNVYLTKAVDSYKVLKDLATNFIGMLYFIDGKVTPIPDAPSYPVANFTKANVIDGKFEYEGTGSKTRPNQAVVYWNNPRNDYKIEPLLVEDRQNISETGTTITQEVTAMGCTSEAQASRYGKWKLWTAANQQELVTFSTGINGAFVTPGDIVNIQDGDRTSVRYGGFVSTQVEKHLTIGNTYTANTEIGSTAFSATVRGQPVVMAGEVVLPSTFSNSSECLFEHGGDSTGTWIGVLTINDEKYFGARTGDGNASVQSTTNNAIVKNIKISDIPEFDDLVHTVAWEIHPTEGTLRLWIDGRLIMDEATSNGSELENSIWSGSNPGGWGRGYSTIAGDTSPWARGTAWSGDFDSGLRTYSNQRAHYSSKSRVALDSSVTLDADSEFEISTVLIKPTAYALEDMVVNSVSYSKGDIIDKAFVDPDGNGIYTFQTLDTEDKASNAKGTSSATSSLSLGWKENIRTETREVSTSSGTHNVLEVSSDFTEAPESGSIWALKETTDGLTVEGSIKEYKILSLAQSTDGTKFDIVAVEHYDSKFDSIEGTLSTYVVEPINRDIVSTDAIPKPRAVHYRPQQVTSSSTLQGSDVVIDWEHPLAESISGLVYDADDSQDNDGVEGDVELSAYYKHLAGYELIHDFPNYPSPMGVEKGPTELVFEKVPEGTYFVELRTRNTLGNLSEPVQIGVEVRNNLPDVLNRFPQGLPTGGASSTTAFMDVNGTYQFRHNVYGFRAPQSTAPFLSNNSVNTDTYKLDCSGMSTTTEHNNNVNTFLDDHYYVLIRTTQSSNILKLLRFSRNNSYNIPYWYDAGDGSTTGGLTSTLEQEGIQGTVSKLALSTRITGTGTSFTSDFQVGDLLVVGSQAAKISFIESDTRMEVDRDMGAAFTNSKAQTTNYRIDIATETIIARVYKHNTDSYQLVSLMNIDSSVTPQQGKTSILYQKVANNGNAPAYVQAAGTFANPADGNTGWTLSIPEMNNDKDIVYAISRIFTSDGSPPQESGWSTPFIHSRRQDGDRGPGRWHIPVTSLPVTSAQADTAWDTNWDGRPGDPVTNDQAYFFTGSEAAPNGQTVFLFDGTTWNSQSEVLDGQLLFAESIKEGKLEANAITANKIAANAITTDKLQANAITTDTLAANAITTDKVSANSITTEKLQANILTAKHFTASTILADLITANSIKANDIKSNSITAEKIAANSINANSIAANSITTETLKANVITTSHITSQSVVSDLITANSIKSADIKANTISAAEIATGAIDANHVTATSVVANLLNANSVKAGEIKTDNIAAITADLGDITAGTLRTSGVNYIPDANDVPSGNESGAFIDLNNGRFVFGDAGASILWDGDELKLSGVQIDATSNIDAIAGVIVQEDATTQATAATTLDFTTGLNVAGTDNTLATISVDTNTIATKTYVDTQVSGLVDSAPAALDTLNELAAALGDDASFSSTVNTALGNRVTTTSDQALKSTTALTIDGSTLTLTKADDSTDTVTIATSDTTYDLTVPEATTNISLAGSDSSTDNITISGGTNVTVTRTDATTLTLSSTNTEYTAGDGISLPGENGTQFKAAVDGTTIELSATDGTGVIRAKTDVVADGGTALATGDQINDFVIGKGYTTNTGTVTSVAAGNGLTGDAVTTAGNLAVGAGDGITVNTNNVAVNVDDTTIEINASAKVAAKTAAVAENATGLATAGGVYTYIANQNFSDTEGTVTSVSGGDGLTGTVTSSGSLAVGAGSGITVNADNVAVTVDDTTIEVNNSSKVAAKTGSVEANAATLVTGGTVHSYISQAGFSTTNGTVTSVSGGSGLTGTVTSSGSLAVGAGNGIAVADDSVSVSVDDVTLKINASAKVAAKVAAIQENGTALATAHQIYSFVTGLNYTTNVGDITQVLAGNGMTGGGDSGAVTLTVVGGDGITSNSDEIEVSVDNTTIELSGTDGSGLVQAKTADIADGGTALATADQIHSFVSTNYAGTVTSVGGGDGLSGTVTSSGNLSVDVDDTTIQISNAKVAAKTATVVDGGAALATGDQIHTFVTGQGYTTNTGTVTSVEGGDGLSGTVTTSGSLSVVVDDTTLELSANDGSGSVQAKTDTIQDGGTALATADQIHTFVTGQGYTTNTGTVTSVGGGNGLSGTVTTSGDLAVDVDDATIKINASAKVAAKTATIVDGGGELATGDQIHTFVTGQGYTTNTGTVTGITAGNLIDVDATTAATPTVAVDLSELDETTDDMESTDLFVVLDAGNQKKIQASNVPLTALDNTGFTATADGGNASTLDGQAASYYLNTSTSFSGDVSGTYDSLALGTQSDITMTGTLKGPASFTIDPADADGTHGNNNGTLIIAGNLQVDGTTTTINSTTLDVDDLNITLAKGAANAAAANGAGITVDVGTNNPTITAPTITYKNSDDTWNLNKDLVVAGGSGTIGGSDLSNARILAGTTSAGLGIDNNEIAVKGDDLFIETIDAKDIRFRTSGTAEKMRIRSDGNVGIGSSKPQTSLHVFKTGDATKPTDMLTIETYRNDVGNNFTGGAIKFVNSDGNSAGMARIKVGSANHADPIGLNAESSQSFIFETSTNTSVDTTSIDGDSSTITVNHSAHTFTAGQKISINSGDYQGSYYIDTVVSNTQFTIADTNHDLDADSSGTPNIIYGKPRDSMILRADGHVGIGTNSPANILHVYDNANRASIKVQNNNHSALFEAYGTATAIDSDASNGIILRISGSNKVHLDNNGNFGIGTDDPASKLQVEALGIDTTTTAVATTNETVIDTVAKATFRTIKYTVQITQGTKYQASELLVLHDGTTAIATEFAKLETNGVLGTINTDIDGDNLRLKVTMASGDAATVKIVRYSVTV